ncbi:hypothetical protein G9409_09825 [Chlorobium sp. BLA1]|uniref:hypothetical protein n=1 Tax=Candidatus Chlorobium masyuteum TaxID=2716876 RepID=UPI001422D8BE|nr:hypothetical protein [Candidatus Chlorobium masyuteum]NHQ60870.1 hypothetical protein [Candidatus Chlorobium masyuteum]
MAEEKRETTLGDKSVYIETFESGNISIQIFQYDSNEIIKEITSAINENTQQELFVIILCENINTISQIPELSSISNYYNNNSLEWKPFNEKTITELLLEYEKESGYKVRYLNFNYAETTEISSIVEFEDVFLSKIVIITDGLALDDKKINFTNSIDHKMHIGGFLLPLDENINPKTKDYYKKYCANFFPRMCARYKSYNQSYSNIIIEAKDSTQFFRGLTSFAKILKIKSANSGSLFAKFKNEALDILRPDGR